MRCSDSPISVKSLKIGSSSIIKARPEIQLETKHPQSLITNVKKTKEL